MYKDDISIHILCGERCGCGWGNNQTFPQLFKTGSVVHEVFTFATQLFSQATWIKNAGSIGVKVSYSHNPQALLPLLLFFKKIKAVVKLLFNAKQSTIIGGQIGVL